MCVLLLQSSQNSWGEPSQEGRASPELFVVKNKSSSNLKWTYGSGVLSLILQSSLPSNQGHTRVTKHKAPGIWDTHTNTSGNSLRRALSTLQMDQASRCCVFFLSATLCQSRWLTYTSSEAEHVLSWGENEGSNVSAEVFQRSSGGFTRSTKRWRESSQSLREIKEIDEQNQNNFSPWLLLLTNTHEIRDLRKKVYFPVRHLSFKFSKKRSSDKIWRTSESQRSDWKYFIPVTQKQLRSTFVGLCSATTAPNLRSRNESENSFSTFRGSSIWLFLFRRNMQTKSHFWGRKS